ncbi:MAG: molybdenum cofactor guanylyltransferase MobA [Geminicoccaceae bacterium]
MPQNDFSSVWGILLAGGQARRMGGGDKPLRTLAGRQLLDHVISRLRPQCAGLVINANGDPARFRDYGLPIVPDVIEGFAGPLAGILSGLEWLRTEQPTVRWALSAATDTPFLPTDLVARLDRARSSEAADIAVACSGGRSHPVFGLWPTATAPVLRQAVIGDGERKIDTFTARYKVAGAVFSTEPVDPFFNANRPEDLAHAERLTRQAG